ncbi:Otogelin-like protein Precursor [Channa argus]|uniref:Otogelin-like protein n=1 Tax=Channa argus TaxID=215402 RepID=A0A6G1PFR1_CHAAH|nr:Otogelin-like protein Precursor [Channa argus]
MPEITTLRMTEITPTIGVTTTVTTTAPSTLYVETTTVPATSSTPSSTTLATTTLPTIPTSTTVTTPSTPTLTTPITTTTRPLTFPTTQPPPTTAVTTSSTSTTSVPLTTTKTITTPQPAPAETTTPTDTSTVALTTIEPTTEPVTTEIVTSPETSPITEETSTTPPFIFPTTPCTPPYSYRIDECAELICFNGELLLHNSSLHCRYNTTQPQCSLLGLPILISTDPCCPLWQCPCRCTVMSDLRVITFDGNNVALYDNGSYILVNLPRETIIGTVEKCPTSQSVNSIRRTSPTGGTSGLCFKKLNITTSSYRIIINRLDRKVTVNYRPVKLPFSRHSLYVEDTGSMYLIHTPGGMSIQWYHSTGIMVLQYISAYNTSVPTHGLCALRCPPGKEYKPCVSTCTSRTCLNKDYYEETTCSFIREECVCRSGTILHRADSPYCVTEDRCDNEGNPRAPGEVWNGSSRSCCLYKCMENGSVVAVEPDCSSVPTPLCEREGEYVLDVLEEGACCPKKICEKAEVCLFQGVTVLGPGKEDGKTCKRVAIRTTIRKDDCRSNAPVTVYSCDGKCPSATIFNFNINSHARFCKCCRESGLQTRSVTLYCSRNATVVEYNFQEPLDCSCQWN